MKRITYIIFFISSILTFCFAQETYNLEVIFQRTKWDSYPNMDCWGSALAGGDINDDGYSDLAIWSDRYLGSSWYEFYTYIFFGDPVMDTIYDAVLHCPGAFGHRTAALCISDINNDSIGDVLIGDHAAISGYGEVRIFFGGSPFDTTVDLILHGEADGSAYGDAIACGDINGDGSDDIIVGAYAYNGFTLNGRVYIYYGGSLLDTLPDIIIDGYNGESRGITVGSGGDVNDDGYEDIVVGAFNNSEAGVWAGKVYVFHGGNPMDTIPDCWMHGEGAGHSLGLFGCDIMRVQNTYDMVITSTSLYDGNSYGRGKVYILYGGDPMDSLPDIWMIGETDSSSLGTWCCSAGDVDGDDNEDALVGAPCDYAFFGCGYIWLGNMPMDREPDAYLKGEFPWQNIGWKVASAGDVDGDSKDEVMFSNYAGVDPTVWVCKYTGPGIIEYDNAIKNSHIHVGPNPFANVLKISLDNGLKDRTICVSIYDVIGREVVYHVIEPSDRPSVINTRLLPRGIYFVHVSQGSESIIAKVVKIK